MIYNIITYNDSGDVDDVITFTVVKDMKEDYQGEITEYPIEAGSVITDHVRTKSPVIDISGLVTEYSYFDSDNALWWSEDDFTTINEVNGITPKNRHLEIKEKLKGVYNRKKPFTLIGVDDVYLSKNDEQIKELSDKLNTSAIEKFNNCLIQSLSFPKSSGDRGVLVFSLSIKQVFFTEIVVKEIEKNSVKKVVPIKNGQSQTGLDANGDPAIAEAQDDAKTKSEKAWTKDDLEVSNRHTNSMVEKQKVLEETGKDIYGITGDNSEYSYAQARKSANDMAVDFNKKQAKLISDEAKLKHENMGIPQGGS